MRNLLLDGPVWTRTKNDNLEIDRNITGISWPTKLENLGPIGTRTWRSPDPWSYKLQCRIVG